MAKFYENNSFWKNVITLALLFFVFVNIIKFVVALFKGETFSAIIEKASTSDYLISNFFGAVVYGLIMAFYYKRRAKKNKSV
jgi:hypothetical protein